jgi:hypothetical protein
MGLLELLIIVLVVMLLIGRLPAWPYSRSWGYYPSGGALTIGLIALLMYLLL